MVLLDAPKIPKVSTEPGVAGKNYEPPKSMIEKMCVTYITKSAVQEPQKTGICQQNWKQKNWKPANKNQKMKSHGCDSTWRWQASGNDWNGTNA